MSRSELSQMPTEMAGGDWTQKAVKCPGSFDRLKAVLLSLVIVSLLFAVFSTRPIMYAWTSLADEQTYNTLALNTVSKDAYIWSAQTDANLGAEFRLDFGFDNYSSSVYRVLIQFDLPPALSRVNIISATLNLSNYGTWSGGYPSGEALRICRVTHDWVEGTGNWTVPTQDGVTWNEYDYADGLTTAANNWAMPGGDYTLADSSTFTIPLDPPWVATSWTVTNIVKSWVNDTHPNCGFLIKLDNESGAYKGAVFDSKEYAEEYGYGEATLEITYTIPTIESCSPVGDKKDYFESGETVYMTGGDYSPSTMYNFYIVADVETWTDGMAIPERVPDTAVTVSSNIDGKIPPTAVWSGHQTVGKYDILVDVDGNSRYDAGMDALDDNDVEVTGGIFIPEFPSFLALLLFMTAALLAVAVYRKKRFSTRYTM